MKNLGRNVKNTASIAYERFGASVTSRVIDNELVYYAQLISEVMHVSTHGVTKQNLMGWGEGGTAIQYTFKFKLCSSIIL